MFTDVSYSHNNCNDDNNNNNSDNDDSNNNLKTLTLGYIGGEDGGVNVCVGVLFACVRSRVCVEGRIILKEMYACF